MKAALAREWTIWNQMMNHEERLPVSQPAIPEKPIAPSKWKNSKSSLLVLSFLLFTLGYWNYNCSLNPLDRFLPLAIPESETVESFELTYPLPDYGKPVHFETLLYHSFGSSWGHPASANYSSPAVDFNRVILEINTTVSGRQYDRLAHLYLNGVPLWRTSTAEPGGKHVHFSARKDVYTYVDLFRRDGNLMFQLDNLVTERLTGVFNVTVTAYYYDKPKRERSFFSAYGPASQIMPLVKSVSQRPPLVYLPSKPLEMQVPILNRNTTRAKLELFVSGNAAEEFWYANVLNKYVGQFKNHPLLGHGPCRVVNVFVDGKRVSSAHPEPVIYTGGISPALWRPVVGAGAFDVKPLSVDLSPLLPLMWKDETSVEVQVSNCLNETIGQNWIATGNLLTWESSLVKSAEGELLSTDNSTKALSFGIPMPDSLQQVVEAKMSNSAAGFANYTLHNGTKVNVLYETQDKVSLANVQSYKQFGDSQKVVVAMQSDNSIVITDADTSHPIVQFNASRTDPLVLDLLVHSIDGHDVDYTVDIVKVVERDMWRNNKKTFTVKSKQKGSSSYFLSPDGNHGYGSTEHILKSKMYPPLPRDKFSRKVVVVNGTIVSDGVKDQSTEVDVDISQAEPVTGLLMKWV